MLFNITNSECLKLEYETLSIIAVDNTFIQLDASWIQSESRDVIDFRKGYSIDSRLEDIDAKDKLRGNYCIIQYKKITKTWSVYHDSIRGFPIYYNDSNISNIVKLEQEVRPNETIEMAADNVSLDFYQRIKFKDHTELVSHADAAEIVEQEILSYVTDFIKYNDSIPHINTTFGYDTNTIRAVIEYHNVPHVLLGPMEWELDEQDKLRFLHSATDDTLWKHMSQKQWGFKQLYVSDKPQTLVTGFWGDEYLMRNPKAVYYFLKQFNIDFRHEVEKQQDSYMYNFINNHYYDEFEKCYEDATSANIANALMCDYQMWGFNTTQTLVPYKNIKLLEIGFRLSTDDALDQALNATIQHAIIEKCNSAILDTIVSNKNE